MNDIFDDYKFKNIQQRVTIKFKQKTCKILSPWEISSFINSFNTYYYKLDVFNTIGIALKQNIDPKNIIIFDKSFNINQQYIHLNNIKCNTEQLQYLYTLGKPISLFPNDSIFFMNELFENFRRLNELLYQINKKYLPIKTIHTYYTRFLKDKDKVAIIDTLEENARALIKNVTNEKHIKNFNLLIESIKKETKKLDREFLSLNNMVDVLSNGQFDHKKLDAKLYQKYFRRFYSLLTNIPRPVIGVLNEKDQSISILCKAHFNKKERNAVTLDLKSISHNSPIEAVIAGGILTLIIAFRDENKKDTIHQLDLKKKELEIKLLEEKIEEQKIKTTTAELERINQYIEVLQNIEKLIQANNEITANKAIKNPYIRQQIDIELSKLNKRIEYLIEKNNFEADPSSIKTIDLSA